MNCMYELEAMFMYSMQACPLNGLQLWFQTILLHVKLKTGNGLIFIRTLHDKFQKAVDYQKHQRIFLSNQQASGCAMGMWSSFKNLICNAHMKNGSRQGLLEGRVCVCLKHAVSLVYQYCVCTHKNGQMIHHVAQVFVYLSSMHS